jgi:hypothetical protein
MWCAATRRALDYNNSHCLPHPKLANFVATSDHHKHNHDHTHTHTHTHIHTHTHTHGITKQRARTHAHTHTHTHTHTWLHKTTRTSAKNSSRPSGSNGSSPDSTESIESCLSSMLALLGALLDSSLVALYRWGHSTMRCAKGTAGASSPRLRCRESRDDMAAPFIPNSSAHALPCLPASRPGLVGSYRGVSPVLALLWLVVDERGLLVWCSTRCTDRSSSFTSLLADSVSAAEADNDDDTSASPPRLLETGTGTGMLRSNLSRLSDLERARCSTDAPGPVRSSSARRCASDASVYLWSPFVCAHARECLCAWGWGRGHQRARRCLSLRVHVVHRVDATEAQRAWTHTHTHTHTHKSYAFVHITQITHITHLTYVDTIQLPSFGFSSAARARRTWFSSSATLAQQQGQREGQRE